MQECSSSGRIPAKLKLSCKQGGSEQQTRSYTMPFPNTAASLLRATALGSVDPAVAQSSAVHTLIPNLAPRTRLQQQGLGTSSGVSSGALGGTFGAVGFLGQVHMPGADEFSKAPGNSCKDAGDLLNSGGHQEAWQAIFQAAMSLLKPKLAEPTVVNFMSVAGMCELLLGFLLLLLHVFLHVSCSSASISFACTACLVSAAVHCTVCSAFLCSCCVDHFGLLRAAQHRPALDKLYLPYAPSL